jgi:hypothetical protein
MLSFLKENQENPLLMHDFCPLRERLLEGNIDHDDLN